MLEVCCHRSSRYIIWYISSHFEAFYPAIQLNATNSVCYFRYVSRDELCQYWEEDGIENSSEVFDALQLSSSGECAKILFHLLSWSLVANVLYRNEGSNV